MTDTTDDRAIQAVLFDFGGVFTTSPLEAIRKVGEAVGADYEQSLLMIFGSYHEDTDHPWHQTERGELTLREARKAIGAAAKELGFEIDLYKMMEHMGADGGLRPPIVEWARQLRPAGFGTALVTNNVAELRDLWRPLLPLDELFDIVIDSSEVGVRKPDPRIYQMALDHLGVAAERAVFLDDFDGNVAAAENIGIKGILVPPDPQEAFEELAALLGLRPPVS